MLAHIYLFNPNVITVYWFGNISTLLRLYPQFFVLFSQRLLLKHTQRFIRTFPYSKHYCYHAQCFNSIHPISFSFLSLISYPSHNKLTIKNYLFLYQITTIPGNPCEVTFTSNILISYIYMHYWKVLLHQTFWFHTLHVLLESPLASNILISHMKKPWCHVSWFGNNVVNIFFMTQLIVMHISISHIHISWVHVCRFKHNSSHSLSLLN